MTVVRSGGPLSVGAVVAGQVTVGTTEVRLPSATARRFRLRSAPTNSMAAVISIGPTGLSVSSGYLLTPGDMTPPLEVTNLNVIYAIASASGQLLLYFGEV